MEQFVLIYSALYVHVYNYTYALPNMYNCKEDYDDKRLRHIDVVAYKWTVARDDVSGSQIFFFM